MIKNLEHRQQSELREFVLGIQNGEFGLGFREEEQLDLLDTFDFYKDGGFWIAEFDGKIIGCIGLQKLNSTLGVLRKLFVQKELRGKELNIAQKLFDKLINEANSLGLEKILLDTPAVAEASHRFYQRNGFREIGRAEIPDGYVFPDRNSKIFELKLK